MAGTGSATGWASFFWIAFERSENPMALLEIDRTLVAVNPAFATALGYTASELAGRRADFLVAPGGWRRMEADWTALRRVGTVTGERELVRADGRHVRVQFAAHDEVVTGRELILSVLVMIQLNPITAPGARGASPGALTPRELEIVTKVALGRRTPEIARELHIAPSTVKTHLRNAMSKVGARSQAQLVARALATGMLDADAVRREIEGEAMPIPDTTAFGRAVHVLLGHMTDGQIAQATDELRKLEGSDADRDFYHGLATAWDNYVTQRAAERPDTDPDSTM